MAVLDESFWRGNTGAVQTNDVGGLTVVGQDNPEQANRGIQFPQQLSGERGLATLDAATQLQSGFNAPPPPQLSGEEKAQAFFDANFRDVSEHPNFKETKRDFEGRFHREFNKRKFNSLSEYIDFVDELQPSQMTNDKRLIGGTVQRLAIRNMPPSIKRELVASETAKSEAKKFELGLQQSRQKRFAEAELEDELKKRFPDQFKQENPSKEELTAAAQSEGLKVLKARFQRAIATDPSVVLMAPINDPLTEDATKLIVAPSALVKKGEVDKEGDAVAGEAGLSGPLADKYVPRSVQGIPGFEDLVPAQAPQVATPDAPPPEESSFLDKATRFLTPQAVLATEGVKRGVDLISGGQEIAPQPVNLAEGAIPETATPAPPTIQQKAEQEFARLGQTREQVIAELQARLQIDPNNADDKEALRVIMGE